MAEDRVEITQKSTAAANSVTIFVHAITDPRTTLIITSKPNSPDPESEPDAIVSSPHFLTVLLVVVGLTVAFIVLWGLIAFFGSTETDNRQEFLSAISHFATVGVGAIVGLLGGKVLS